MITSKRTELFTIIGLAAALLLSLLLMRNVQTGGVSGKAGIAPEYVKKLFGTEKAVSLNIHISEENWKKLLDNPEKKEYMYQ